MIIPRLAVAALLTALASCGEPPSIVVEPLQIIAWSPSDGAACIAVAADEFIGTVTFSDDIESLSQDNLFVRARGGSEALTLTPVYDKATFSATLRLSGDLAYGGDYELVATRDVVGVNSGHLAREWVSTFQTRSTAGCF